MMACESRTRSLLLVKSGGEEAVPEWRQHFQEFAPELEVRSWNDPDVDRARVHYALVWQPEPGRLASYPNLKLILSSAAGVDHITTDPDWPRGIPLLRASTVESAQRMGEYVCMGALALLKNLPRLIHQQGQRVWQPFDTARCATETTVGLLGLGNLGVHCARMLSGLGFRVCGWSRTSKTVPGVECHVGEDGLQQVLGQSHIIVCLLPATAETAGVLDAEAFNRMPPGGSLINVARGAHVVRADLVQALDSCQLSGAVLDVFEEEPLPVMDAFWRHEKVIVTPHMASIAGRRSRVQFFARQIQAQRAGEPLHDVYDHERGY
jgi:glyoxylate/hydroxypyruvate reductase A